MWEHFGTLHRAVADYGPDEHRLMKRCQVLATKIFDPAFRELMFHAAPSWQREDTLGSSPRERLSYGSKDSA
jgi:hypothetical protein